ncbi:homocysteine S-methyltransferase [Lactobacillus sp. ESL0731]|uniref:homocysteine S-methyltransferase n=1 Tax=unclassified Lactobacillus TaxID=2620435 RepID=UPI0023F86AEC|nr:MULTISPECIES: homocysteine S-methyltransferase [unclassified Lactobacillus]WEV50939.1 homocysteine S-methyltransferase [Lactobacillus sp. ESL0700]WEV62070.1 homocysteine S-methyltransferase [Lactobacillus sp. ESL0731]
MDLLTTIHNKGLILDGAMSDELEKQGVPTNNKLWTAAALRDNLQAVYQAHWDYLQAGAQLIITDTYQANIPAFIKAGYTEQEAKELITDAVKIAKKARDDYERKTGKHNFVAASIGSYGAYLANGNEFCGDYNLTSDEYLDFHLPRLKTVITQQPDCLAIETQPKLAEVTALLTWLAKNEPQIPVYVSFTLHDTVRISDGTSLKKVVETVNNYPQVFAVGVNCVKPALVTPAIKTICQFTNQEIVVYPNQGYAYDSFSKTWLKINRTTDFYQSTKEWYEAGAHLIGGCCTTGPEQTREIARAFQEI